MNLTSNLKFIRIEENNVKEDELLAVACYFRFYGEECAACVSIDKIGQDYPSYRMIEALSELSDSFNGILNRNDIWFAIVGIVMEFIGERNNED